MILEDIPRALLEQREEAAMSRSGIVSWKRRTLGSSKVKRLQVESQLR